MERTNETSTGYTYNNQNFKNEVRTDSQGNSYNVSIPTSSIQPTTPINVATPQYKDYTTGLSANNSYVQSAFDTAQTNADNEQAKALAQSQELAKNQAMLGLKGADTAEAYKSTGATDLAGQIRKLNAQSQALAIDTQAKTLAEQNKATGQNITSSAVQRNTADVTRENFINQANIAMQVAIKTADYQTAKDLADQIVNAKYDKVLADIEALKTNLQGIKDFLVTPAQKKAADARETLLKKQEQEIADKIAQEKSINDIGMTLRKYGVSDSVVKDVLGSGSINEALIKAGNNLQDPQAKLELQSLKADIALKYAQIAKTNREAQLSKEPTVSEKEAQAQAISSAQASAQAAQDKIDAVNTALNYNAGISSRVGTNIFSRGIVAPVVGGAVAGAGAGPLGALAGGVAAGATGVKSALTGQGQQLSGTVHQLTAGLTLQNLIDAKKNGATFGSLTDGERQLLASSATKLNDWEIKDKNGVGTGYWNIDEKSFRAELKTIQDLSKKALLQSQGTLISPDENTQLDSMFQDTTNSAGDYFN